MEDVGFHNNIVCMIGSLHNAKKPLLIVEFCALGDLHSYLRDVSYINMIPFHENVNDVLFWLSEHFFICLDQKNIGQLLRFQSNGGKPVSEFR